MSNTQSHSMLLPVGRLLAGDLYEPGITDMKGNPLVINSGPNKGQSRVDYWLAYGIQKTKAQWWEEPWGAEILAKAHEFWPQGQAGRLPFSWKISDGDSAELVISERNPAGTRNCDREGYPGHWIVRIGSGYAPKIVDVQGNPLTQPGLVKRGYYIEAFISMNSNEQITKPGIYINHNAIAYRAPGKEITSGLDTRKVGFGASALPPGVTAIPTGNAAAIPGATAPAAATPPAPPYSPPAPPAAPAPTPPLAVTPQPAFLAPPGAPAAPSAPPAPPAAPSAPPPPPVVAVDPLGAPAGYRMMNPAGARYANFQAQGWTDIQLVQAGHMVKL